MEMETLLQVWVRQLSSELPSVWRMLTTSPWKFESLTLQFKENHRIEIKDSQSQKGSFPTPIAVRLMTCLDRACTKLYTATFSKSAQNGSHSAISPATIRCRWLSGLRGTGGRGTGDGGRGLIQALGWITAKSVMKHNCSNNSYHLTIAHDLSIFKRCEPRGGHAKIKTSSQNPISALSYLDDRRTNNTWTIQTAMVNGNNKECEGNVIYISLFLFFSFFRLCVCVCVCVIYWSIEGWSSARKSTGWRICLLLVLSPPEWRAFNLSEPLTKCVTHKMPVRVSHVSDGNWSFPEPNRPRPWLHSSRSARRAHRPVLPSRTALMKSIGTIRSESMETRTQQLDLMRWFVHSFGSRAAAALHSITPSVLTFENNVWMVVLCSRSDCCPQIRCQLVYNPGKYGRLDLLWVPIPTDAWQKSFAMMESSQGDHSSAGWRHRNKKRLETCQNRTQITCGGSITSQSCCSCCYAVAC